MATVVAAAPNADLSLGVGVAPGVFCADLDPGAVGALDPGVGGWPEEDEMSLAVLGKRWSMVYGSDVSNEYTTS